jgi:hypothetical protein
MQENPSPRRIDCAMIGILVITLFVGPNAFGQANNALNDYSPVFEKGIYVMRTGFDSCKINLQLRRGDRLWFDGGWAAFIDQEKSKIISARDARVVQSSISWEIKPPVSYGDYWLWMACDPPIDPAGISLADSSNVCQEKTEKLRFGSRDSERLLIIHQRKWKGNLTLDRSKKSRAAKSLSFCIYDKSHTIIGGGEVRRKKESISSVFEILKSVDVVDR